jgi:O-antigen/teichoic acid export membrane protein
VCTQAQRPASIDNQIEMLPLPPERRSPPNGIHPTRWLRVVFRHRLYRNSALLVLDNGLLGLAGGVFALVIAHFWAPSAIGAVAAINGILMIITALAAFGLPSMLLRYIASELDQRRLLRHAILITSFIGVGLVLLVFTVAPETTRPFSEFHSGRLELLLTAAVLVGSNSITNVCDPSLLSSQNVKWILVKDQSAMAVRFGLLAVMIFLFKRTPIALLAVAAVYATFGAGFDLITLHKLLAPPPPPSLGSTTNERRSPLRGRLGFTLGNYLATVTALVPTTLLPTFVNFHLGSAAAGYVSISMLLVGGLVIVPSMTAQSLFAELAVMVDFSVAPVRRALQASYLATVPVAILVAYKAHAILSLFGRAYAAHATSFLAWAALSAIFFAFNYVGDVVLLSRNKVRAYLFVNVLGALSVVLGILVGMRYGLRGAGVGFFVGQAAYCLISTLTLVVYAVRRRSFG